MNGIPSSLPAGLRGTDSRSAVRRKPDFLKVMMLSRAIRVGKHLCNGGLQSRSQKCPASAQKLFTRPQIVL